MGCVVCSAGNASLFPLQNCPQLELPVCQSRFYAMRSRCLCMLEGLPLGYSQYVQRLYIEMREELPFALVRLNLFVKHLEADLFNSLS